MKYLSNRFTSPYLLAVALTAFLMVMNKPVIAAPGAHGPNGEHLDAPTTVRATSTLPRIEAILHLYPKVSHRAFQSV